MSRKRGSLPLAPPPVEIIRGAQITAEYLAQEVADFRDNPFTEALTPTLSPREVTEYLLQLPPYPDDVREVSQVARWQMAETAREFFVPNGKHLIVYYAITSMIRRGYVRRNPVLWGYWKQVHKNIESFLKAIKEKPFPNSRARGLTIIGPGGTGKSTTAEKILQSMPQVITHVSYKGQVFIMRQLVWLKLDCPRQGSLRELCVTFFRAVDEILDTNYHKNYAGNSHRTIEELIAGMVRVAANHGLGIIFIDEIQDLSEARSGGEITMVNFFVHLENALGIPFGLIGTKEAIPLISGQVRHARRASEQGLISWDRMSEVEVDIEEFDDDDDDDDEEHAAGSNTAAEASTNQGGEDAQKKIPKPDLVWKNFVETMWQYQYVKHPRGLKENVVEDKCARALYRAAKGIPAVVQTVFVLTQQLAILTEEEKIPPRLIRETVRINQQVIEELLVEARMKTPRALKPVGDLSDLDDVYEAEISPDESPISPIEVSESYAADTITTKVDNGAGKQLKQHGKTTAKARTETGLMSSVTKNNKKADGKLSRSRAKHSQDNCQVSITNSGGPAKGVSGKKDKYRKSPEEYLSRKQVKQ